jgi:L-iditol 2-dehydrogenase
MGERSSAVNSLSDDQFSRKFGARFLKTFFFSLGGSLSLWQTFLKMKAAVLHGKEDVRIEEVAPAKLKAGEVRIAIEAALTCGTDLKVFKRGYHAKMIVPPAVFGHELAGTICEVAQDVSQWKIGERVVVANSAPCGECFFCKNQQENLCDDLLFLNGAYAESIVVPARLVKKNLLRLKPETAFRDAALTEALACVVQGVEDCKLRAGQNVLVIGAGPIGLMFVALAKNLGCNVTVIGRGEQRLQAAKKLGADRVAPASGGCETKSEANSHPRDGGATQPPMNDKFDVVIEAVGKPETWEMAVKLVRKGGTVNFFGGCPAGTTVSFDTSLIHYSNLTLLASFHHTPRTIRRALEFIESGVIRAKDFVDGECALSELSELFHSMAAGNRAVKTLVCVKQ